MPMYKYRCTNNECGRVVLRRRRVNERNDDVHCNYCDSPAERAFLEETRKGAKIVKPYVDHNLAPDPIEVRGPGHHKQLKQKHGVREKESYVE